MAKVNRQMLILYALLTLGQMHAHPSWGIVVDDNHNIYFADLFHHGVGSVWKLTANGELQLLLRDFHAHNVNLDADGNLITANGEGLQYMVRISPAGHQDTLIQSNDYREFNGGNAAITPRGQIFFGAEKYLWRINEIQQKEKIGDFEFGWNQTVFADRDGNYYGPDIGGGIGRVIKINPDGMATVFADELITKFDRPWDPHFEVLLGMAEGCGGAIYIAEVAGKRIIRMTDHGEAETYYTAEGYWVPSGLTFHECDAYILEFEDHQGYHGPRIVRLTAEGGKSVVFDYDTYQRGQFPGIPAQEPRHRGDWLAIFGMAGMAILILTLVRYSRRRVIPRIR